MLLPNTPFVLYPSNVYPSVGTGGLALFTFTFAKETPDAFSPVPTKAIPGIAETERATPFFGKSNVFESTVGEHQSLLPPEPKITSPSSSISGRLVALTVTPVFVPALKCA